MEVTVLFTMLAFLSVTVGFSLALLWAWAESDDD